MYLHVLMVNLKTNILPLTSVTVSTAPVASSQRRTGDLHDLTYTNTKTYAHHFYIKT